MWKLFAIPAALVLTAALIVYSTGSRSDLDASNNEAAGRQSIALPSDSITEGGTMNEETPSPPHQRLSDNEAEIAKESFEDIEINFRSVGPSEDGAVQLAFESDQPYEKLVAMAEYGNGIAAFNLFGFLGNCERMPKFQSELEEGIEELYATRRNPGRSQGNVQNDRFSPAAVEKAVRKTFNQCKSVGEEAIERKLDWLERASDLAYPLAMENYADSIVRTDPNAAFEVYSELWALGGAAGADRMSRMFESGWENNQADSTKAAAYGYIATEVQIAYMDSLGNPYGSTIFDSARQAALDRQHQLLSAVSPREYDEARILAKRLVDSNANCCFN